MRLYATIKSDRASKGQGGNEYLKIIIRDEKKNCIGYLTIKPEQDFGRVEFYLDILETVNLKIDKCLQINTDDDVKS